jgi:hypothetical protein
MGDEARRAPRRAHQRPEPQYAGGFLTHDTGRPRAMTVRSRSACIRDTDPREAATRPAGWPGDPARGDPAAPAPAGRAGSAPAHGSAAGSRGSQARRRPGPGEARLAGERRQPARPYRGIRDGRLGRAPGPLPGLMGSPGAARRQPAPGLLGEARPPHRGPVPGCRAVAPGPDSEPPSPFSGRSRVPSLTTARRLPSTVSPQASNRPRGNILGSSSVTRRTCCIHGLTWACRPGTVGGVESRPWGRSWRACSGASSAPQRLVRLAPQGAIVLDRRLSRPRWPRT